MASSSRHSPWQTFQPLQVEPDDAKHDEQNTECFPDGDQLTMYTGSDTAAMTVHTELNKLASNCALGRNMAGVHYRADGDYGLDLGEKIAIQYYLDYLSRQTEPYGPITFTKFNGDTFTIPSGGGQTRALGEPVAFERDI